MGRPAPQVLPLRMSYEQYRQLPEDARAEWGGGDVVMAPSLSFRHQQAVRRLANLLESPFLGW